MKRLLTSLFTACIICTSLAQNPTYKQKLYYTCKVWGFVKYFHSKVSVCGVNWDSVLIHCLPLVKSAITDSAFNNALDTMLFAAGPMTLTSSPPCDTMAPELKRNLNFKWINDTLLRHDVQTILDTIKNNFRPHPGCWIALNPYSVFFTYDGGYLKFGSDSIILNINDYTKYPDEWHRLLELFVHWNIINYFNPYNYIQDQPWDSTLSQNIPGIDSAANDAAFFTSLIKITHNMDDEHVQGFTYDNYCSTPLKGLYSPDLVLKFIPYKYVVVKSGVSGIKNGDEIISVNGLTTKQWEDSLRPYVSEGDSAAFHELIMEFMIEQASGSSMTITYYDSANNIHSTIATCNSWLPYQSYCPNDTLANVQWKYWSNCNVGYVNVGKMQDNGSDVATMYSALQSTNAIIFDVRNYPASSAVFDLCNDYLFHSGVPADEYMEPNVKYPGTYTWVHQYFYPGTAAPYKGRVIVLFNEQTISEGEYASMLLGEVPNSVKIGSQTDGTDGNVTYYSFSQDMGTGFTTLGWFYPNGDSTERVGIIPDSLVYPTQVGIRAGRDEVLEKALQVAGCPLAVQNINEPKSAISVYPNPTTNEIMIVTADITGEDATISVTDITGRILIERTISNKGQGINVSMDLSSLSSGVYFVYLKMRDNQLATKLIKL